jgi:hypothetical protein
VSIAAGAQIEQKMACQLNTDAGIIKADKYCVTLTTEKR